MLISYDALASPITAWATFYKHYNDVIMGAIASQITSLTVVFSIVYLDTDQRKRQSSAPLAFVRGIHRRPVNSPHKWPVTRKMFPFDDVIMEGKYVSILGLKLIHISQIGPWYRVEMWLMLTAFRFGTSASGHVKWKLVIDTKIY